MTVRPEPYIDPFVVGDAYGMKAQRPCRWCGTAFQPRRHHAVYCGAECFRAHRSFKQSRGPALVDALVDWAKHRHAPKGSPEAARASRARQFYTARAAELAKEWGRK